MQHQRCQEPRQVLPVRIEFRIPIPVAALNRCHTADEAKDVPWRQEFSGFLLPSGPRGSVDVDDSAAEFSLWTVVPARRSAAHTALFVLDILGYISSGWDSLTRAMNRCESLEDTKTGGAAVLYLPADMPIPATVGELQGRSPRSSGTPACQNYRARASGPVCDPGGRLAIP